MTLFKGLAILLLLSAAWAEISISVYTGQESCGFSDGPLETAMFCHLHEMLRRPDGGILVSDSGNSCIRLITVDGMVSTYLGLCTVVGDSLDPPRFDWPSMILYVPEQDRLYIGDDYNMHITYEHNGTLTLLAGNGTDGSEDGGYGESATVGTISAPKGLAIDLSQGTEGILYYCDWYLATIRKIDIGSFTMQTIAGIPYEWSKVDGPFGTGTMNNPNRIVLYENVLYVPDDDTVRTVDPGTGELGTLTHISGAAGLYGISVIYGSMYVTDDDTGSLYRVNFNGTWSLLVNGTLSTPRGVLYVSRTKMLVTSDHSISLLSNMAFYYLPPCTIPGRHCIALYV